jgi:hypothetical protein
MCYRAGRAVAASQAWRAVSLLISMIAKGFTPENGAKVFAIMKLSLPCSD